jgi:DNA-binding transcriptional ArsR family regulator
MQNYETQVQFYKVLSHPTRLAILAALRDGEQCVCHMEALFGLRQAHISQHLMVLRDAGLVTDRRDGWNIFYRVSKPDIYSVIDAMNGFSGAPQAPAVQLAAGQVCPCPKCNAPADAFIPTEALQPSNSAS